MKKLNNTFRLNAINVIVFIGALIIMSFKYAAKALNYIGGGLFFLYMLIISLPILILTSFKQFLEDPKKFIKRTVIETTQKMMEF